MAQGQCSSEEVEELRQVLALKQGSPAAVGSGRSSLRRKVHAVLHATRLSSPSWVAAVSCLNRTFSWTGDLGVESGLWRFAADARLLMGAFIESEDAAKNPHQSAFEDGAFVIEAVPTTSGVKAPRAERASL